MRRVKMVTALAVVAVGGVVGGGAPAQAATLTCELPSLTLTYHPGQWAFTGSGGGVCADPNNPAHSGTARVLDSRMGIGTGWCDPFNALTPQHWDGGLYLKVDAADELVFGAYSPTLGLNFDIDWPNAMGVGPGTISISGPASGSGVTTMASGGVTGTYVTDSAHRMPCWHPVLTGTTFTLNY